MSVTSGFFNSVNGDRKYNAEQMSAIFDGIINDGILANIGTAFTVTYSSGTTVEVGIGRAWFNSTWLYNDSILPVELEPSEAVLNRIDAVVIEIDRSDGVRAGSIKVVKGTPSNTPSRPAMLNTAYVHQYPLAYIYRAADSTTFSQADITSMIGTSSCPYVTGILQVQNIDNIVAQWGAQWVEWFANETATTEGEADTIIEEWNQWFMNETTTSETEFSTWMTQMKADFEAWLESLQIILGDDTAALLGSEVVVLKERFETLAKDRCVYEELQDDEGDTILDSYGQPIEGRTVFPFGSGTGDQTRVNGLVTFPTFEEHAAKNEEDFATVNQRLDGHDTSITTATSNASSALSAVNAHIANKNNPHGVTPAQIGAYEPSVGDIITTARTGLGDKWLLCNGAVVSRSTYPALSPLIPFNPEGPWVKRTTLGDGLKQIATGLNYYVGVRDSSVCYATSLTGTWAYCMPWRAAGYDSMDGSAGIVFGKNYFVMPILYFDGSWFHHTRIYYFQNPTAQGASYSELSAGTSKQQSPPIRLNDIAFSGSYFAAVGIEKVSNSNQDKAIAYVSANPNGPWTKKDLWSSSYSSSTDAVAFTISYANGYFIAVGYIRESVSSGTNLAIAYTTSPTGTWTYKKLFTDTPSDNSSDGTFSVTKVVYANGKYSFAFSYGDTVYIVESTSPSGTWSYHVVVRKDDYNGYTGVQKLYYIDGFYVLCLPTGYTGDSTVLYSRSSHGPWFRMYPLGTDAIQSLFDTSSMLFASGTDFCGTLDKNSMQLPSISSGLAYSYIKAKT